MTKYQEWNPKKAELSGTSKLIADETYKVIIATNGYKIKECSAGNTKCEISVLDQKNSIYELCLMSNSTADKSWKVIFEKKAITRK